MKKLLSTTALIALIGVPNMMMAQQTDAANDTMSQQENRDMAAFLGQRGQSDIHASELMGESVYMRRADGADGTGGDAATAGSEMPTVERVQLDEMDSIGEINEIILSSDGQVRALVIGVGGFLGMGEQDVAVTMDQVTFASGSDDRSEMYVIVNTGRDMLEGAPAYKLADPQAEARQQDDGSGRGDTDTASTQSTDRTENERAAFVAPDVERDGYRKVEMQEISTDMLTGMSVYDVNDNDVGEVSDMLIGDDGAISHVIIDFGGFLGIGSRQASLEYGELTVLSDEDNDDVRIYVDATKDQVRDLPRYVASN